MHSETHNHDTPTWKRRPYETTFIRLRHNNYAETTMTLAKIICKERTPIPPRSPTPAPPHTLNSPACRKANSIHHTHCQPCTVSHKNVKLSLYTVHRAPRSACACSVSFLFCLNIDCCLVWGSGLKTICSLHPSIIQSQHHQPPLLTN